jgi:hypothetical protein
MWPSDLSPKVIFMIMQSNGEKKGSWRFFLLPPRNLARWFRQERPQNISGEQKKVTPTFEEGNVGRPLHFSKLKVWELLLFFTPL